MFGAAMNDDVDRRVVDRPRASRRSPRANPNERDRLARGARARVSPQTTSSVSNVALGEQRRDAQQRAAVGLAEPAEADHPDADAPARRAASAARRRLGVALIGRRTRAQLVLERVELGAAGHLLDQLVAR